MLSADERKVHQIKSCGRIAGRTGGVVIYGEYHSVFRFYCLVIEVKEVECYIIKNWLICKWLHCQIYYRSTPQPLLRFLLIRRLFLSVCLYSGVGWHLEIRTPLLRRVAARQSTRSDCCTLRFPVRFQLAQEHVSFIHAAELDFNQDGHLIRLLLLLLLLLD